MLSALSHAPASSQRASCQTIGIYARLFTERYGQIRRICHINHRRCACRHPLPAYLLPADATILTSVNCKRLSELCCRELQRDFAKN